MKRIFTLFFALFVGATMLLGQIPPNLTKLTVDTVDYWILNSTTDLIWLSSIDTTLKDADSDGTDDFVTIAEKLGANYRLGQDLIFDVDPAFIDWNNDGQVGVGDDTLGFMAIGPGQNSMPAFTGHFDGRNFAIENIWMNNGSGLRERVSLFGNINGATIENLYVKNFWGKNAQDYGGVICARATYGGPNVFKRIYVDGTYDWTPRTSSGTCHFGGMVGRVSDAEVIECVSKIEVISDPNSHNRIGGLVGTVMGNLVIKDSYATSSSFTAKEKVGLVVGFVDVVDNVSIENCYAAGKVTGGDPVDTEVGSFAGNLKSTVPVSCYWDVDLDTAGVGPESDSLARVAVKGLTTVEFSSMTSFEGWDFDNTWVIGDVDGTNRPYLKWQDAGPIIGIPEKEMAGKSMIKVYPNPASSNMTIENAPVNAEYRVFNMLGQIMESGIITGSNMMLNLENYQKGIYLLMVGESVSELMVE